jgi:nicotinamide phosphoribosyltransferase
MSIILNTDSYKLSHRKMYPPNTSVVHSYIEARGFNDFPEGDGDVVFFGLQPFIQDFLLKPITAEDIDEAERIVTAHGFEFYREGWEIILNEFNGYLPLTIKAVPEGAHVPAHEVLVTVENTDSRFAWLTSYVETLGISHVWYGTTVATLSNRIRELILEYLYETAENPLAEIDFKLHDFGYRGVEPGSAGHGGAAHLINFQGTDNLAALTHVMKYYDTKGVVGYSIPASEHSTITSWTRAGEYEAYLNMVKTFAKPGVTFACVIDSYDIDAALKLWMNPQLGNNSLLDMVKEAGATVVLRPDSGDPVKTPIKVIETLLNHFHERGMTKIVKTHYRVLPDHVRVIQGDGINFISISYILSELMTRSISASNIAFGMGGGLLQHVNRDSLKFAMKASAAMVDGTWRDVMKEPSGDPSKKSKAGRVTLAVNGVDLSRYLTVTEDVLQSSTDLHEALEIVYTHSAGMSSPSTKSYKFEEVRNRAIFAINS